MYMIIIKIDCCGYPQTLCGFSIWTSSDAMWAKGLKGDAECLVRYVGPAESVGDILSKLETQFGQVASSDTLFQTFIKWLKKRMRIYRPLLPDWREVSIS